MEFFTHTALKDGDVVQFDNSVCVYDHPDGFKQLAQKRLLTGNEEATPLPEKQLFLVLNQAGSLQSVSPNALHHVNRYTLIPIDETPGMPIDFKKPHLLIPLDKAVMKKVTLQTDNNINEIREVIPTQHMHVAGHVEFTRTTKRVGNEIVTQTQWNEHSLSIKDKRVVNPVTGRFIPATQAIREVLPEQGIEAGQERV